MDYPSLQPEALIRICAQPGQAPAWEEFIRRFNPLIARVVVKTAHRWGESSRSVQDLPRSRLIFWLYYRSGLSASAIASIPNIGLTTKGVESALLRLTRLVRIAFTEPAGPGEEKRQDSSQDQKGYRQAESF